ncbi:Bacterial protein of unknown function (DUF924) domain containing protein [Naviculisporaceae sp. PSN 640]
MGGGPLSPDELRHILTPELLSFLVKARMPYPKQGPINFSHFGRDIFLKDPVGPVVRHRVWPALIALSKIGLDHMPDLTAYLPTPTDAFFAEQCLGLLLLVDHFPRLFCRGMDQRWTYGYFSPISQRLARKWIALPADQRPDSWERWHQDGAGAGLDYWIGVRFWFGTPFVHSEDRELQAIAVKFTDETRSVVEKMTGKKDPNRKKRDEIFADIYGFPRVYMNGPPQGADVTRESWTFWMGMLMDIHKPIIDLFGRYPYLNATLGRESSDQENTWVEKTGHFGEVSPEIAKRILEDIEKGRWTPLGESLRPKLD